MGNVEIPNWLKGLPLAPEFRPTDTEFADPIAYISKIEKQASAFGICKIIPPLPRPSKKYVFSNLNKSLSKCPELGSELKTFNVSSSPKMDSGNGAHDGEVRAVFTTRQQELGQSVKRAKGSVSNPQSGVHKQVWQSGEIYTLEQFESKSKAFARNLLGMIKEVSPWVIEAMFWKAASEKPIWIEYANDVPGSGFGEPVGQYRYFRRRRRRGRTSYQRTRESSDCNKDEMDNVRNFNIHQSKDAPVQNYINSSSQTSDPSASLSTMLFDETSRSSKRKSSNASSDMEGTAGWKLSNSPWNLQVIARSPGSLTRFMPDDIPGVTSPMVYIGMLFSWFAWHVEDHELHSMNFLHTGSPKTWYAVPGDYAFAFEEAIRAEAYGGNIDRLAALSLLGEKTTLLSPELVVSSGIPCCRLIQNPGEFVVTFPRAYHVGFSHGFNCGEAANFGTPQWLKIAREAAVRRAAMNYLPMLSHQQLLYLLTMSFVSRIPRSLLPGARSSRLRDRQKEERELLVKKAFIEDMLNENNKLFALLGRESTYHAVLWHPDLLPYPSKESQLGSVTATVDTTMKELGSDIGSQNCNKHNLLDEMSFYMETLNDLYMDDDDLSCDFQVDSGTLACVACGILGFPFMSVVQPSERASIELLSGEHLMVQEGVGVSEQKNRDPSQNHRNSVHGCVSDNILPVLDPSLSLLDQPISSITKFEKGWETSSKFLRPRIFCLEHAVQIEELLKSKGGANILVICHSDYQKMKAHAAAVAEEIGSPFSYNDFPLDSASQEELRLIDVAIDDEYHNEHGGDWTSKLGVNLQYCVKVRKNSPSSRVQHALKLGGLFSDKCAGPEFAGIRWQARRCRTKLKLNHPAHCKPCESNDTKIAEMLGKNLNGGVKKEEKLIQYSRRNFKSKPKSSIGASKIQGHQRKNLSKDSSAVTCEDHLDKHGRNISESNLCSITDTENDSAVLNSSVSLTMSKMGHEMRVPELTGNMSLSLSPSQQNADSIASSIAVVGGVGQTENLALKEAIFEGETCTVATCSGMEMQHRMKDPKETWKTSKTSNAETCSSPHAVRIDIDVVCHPDSGAMDEVRADEDVLVNVESIDKYVKNTVGSECCLNSEVCDLVTFDNDNIQQEATKRSSDEEPISCDDPLIDDPSPIVMEEICEGSSGPCAVEDFLDGDPPEDKVQQEFIIANGSTKMPTSVSMIEALELQNQACAAADFCHHGTQENERTTNGHKEELTSSVVRKEVGQATPILGEECRTSCKENLRDGVPAEAKVQQEMPTGGTKVEDSVSSPVLEIRENQPVLSGSGTSRENYQKERANADVISESEMQECSGTREKTCTTENAESDVCSLQENRDIVSKAALESSNSGKGRKRKRELKQETENKFTFDGFIRSPCEGLRRRAGKDTTTRTGIDIEQTVNKKPATKKTKETSKASVSDRDKKQVAKKPHRCDIESCHMRFETKAELSLHKGNRCPYEGCRKKFRSHKYAVLHQRVHDDDRPLKCPWKGCSMSFKWAWARTEHIRVHTGERPYRCKVDGCGLSFRFVSDFSRHRRKTGHYVNSSN